MAETKTINLDRHHHKTTTVTRDYDEKGQVVKEVVVEEFSASTEQEPIN